MGIKCNKKFIYKTQDEFHSIDKIITGYAFDIQNEIGRFCDEKIYQEIMAEKCREESIEAEREVEIVVTFKDFVKKYKLDLLVDNSVIYELKTARSLNTLHKQQLINYLQLTGIKHGKLLNFRPSSVEYEFVSTNLTTKDRYNYFIDRTEWQEMTMGCEKLQSVFTDLLCEWGTFLECRLYNEALIYFLGGSEKVVCSVEIFFNNRIVGKQKMQLLDNETAFHLSAVTRAFNGYEDNIRRLIKHTKIKTVQWINLNQREITLKTIN